VPDAKIDKSTEYAEWSATGGVALLHQWRPVNLYSIDATSRPRGLSIAVSKPALQSVDLVSDRPNGRSENVLQPTATGCSAVVRVLARLAREQC
jgi:hypothetical protein